MSKLRALSALPDNWDGPGSRAIEAASIRAYQQLLGLLRGFELDLEPMATPEGGIRMEWDREPFSYVAELQGNGGMYLCVLGPSDEDDDDYEFADLDVSKVARFYQDGKIDV